MYYVSLLEFLTDQNDEKRNYKDLQYILYDDIITGPLIRAHLRKLLSTGLIQLWLRNPQDNDYPTETVPATFTFLDINHASAEQTISPIPNMSLANYSRMRGMPCKYPELPPIICRSQRTKMLICIPLEHIDVIIEGDDITALQTIRTHGRRWRPNDEFAFDPVINESLVDKKKVTFTEPLLQSSKEEDIPMFDTVSYEMEEMTDKKTN